MTSRFATQYLCLNGPKEDYWIDAPHVMEPGCSCALPWIDVRGTTKYAVYTLMEIPVPEGESLPEGAPKEGLVFVQSHETPERAQNHVHRLTTVIGAAKMANAQN